MVRTTPFWDRTKHIILFPGKTFEILENYFAGARFKRVMAKITSLVLLEPIDKTNYENTFIFNSRFISHFNLYTCKCLKKTWLHEWQKNMIAE